MSVPGRLQARLQASVSPALRWAPLLPAVERSDFAENVIFPVRGVAGRGAGAGL